MEIGQNILSQAKELRDELYQAINHLQNTLGGEHSVNFLKCPKQWVTYIGDLVEIFQMNAHQKLIDKTEDLSAKGGGQLGLLEAAK